MSPKKLVDDCFPESPIKVLLCSSGRLLNQGVNFLTTEVDLRWWCGYSDEAPRIGSSLLS